MEDHKNKNENYTESELGTEEVNESWKLTTWKNEPTFNDLYKDYQSAQEDHALVINNLDKWELNLEGGKAIVSPEGKSVVRPKLIRKQAEWKYPALEEPFLNTTNMFEVNPRTFEDQQGAEQNALLLNYQWTVKIDKVELVGDIVRTDVDEGTVIVKTGWYAEEDTRIVEKEFPIYASPEESLMIMQKAVEMGKLSPEQAQAMIQSGEPMQTGSEIVKVEESYLVENKPTYEVCNNRNIVLDPTANGKVEDLNFIIHEYETDMSSLTKQKYEKEIEINPETGKKIIYETGIYKNLGKVKISRSSDTREYYNDTNSDETYFEFDDKPRKKLRAYEYWGYWDIHDTGEKVSIIATWIGKQIIRMEESPFPFKGLPFSFAKYMPIKNEVYGEPDGELLIDNQETIGKMTRAALDITSDIAVGQEYIDEQFFAGPSQRDNHRSGKTVMFRHGMDPKTSIFKQSIDAVPKTVFDMIAINNNEAESYSGTKSFSQGIGSQALGSVATGIRSALDATSKRELSLLRRLSELFKDLGAKTIAMNQIFLDEEEVVRVTNKEYVSVKREDLAGEFDLIVDVSTPEKDNEKAEKLNMLMQTNAASMDPGLQKIIYSKMAKLWKEPDLEEQIKTYEPEPDPMGEQIKQMQLENAMLENQKIKMEIAKMAKDIESEDSKITERDSRTSQNIESEAEENIANARFKNAQAAKLEEETDILAQDFLRVQDGTKRAEEIENKDLDHLSKQLNMQDTKIIDRDEREEKDFIKEDEATQQHERNLELEDTKALNQMDLQNNQQKDLQNIKTGA